MNYDINYENLLQLRFLKINVKQVSKLREEIAGLKYSNENNDLLLEKKETLMLELIFKLDNLIESLPPREAGIIRCKLNGDSFEEIALKIHYSAGHTKRIYNYAVKSIFRKS